MRSVESLSINTVSTAIEPPLSEAAAEAWIPRTCFKNGPPSRVGVEVELLVADTHHPARSRGALPATPLPSASRRTRSRRAGRQVDRRTRRAGRAQLPPRSNLPHTINAVRQ